MSRSHALIGIIVSLLASAGPVMAQQESDPTAPPRGYSIPIIDLDAQAHRQFIVDREDGQYLGHPTTTFLDDGHTIVCVYPKGHGRGAVLMKKSSDGGRTWSERLPTPENWSTSKETPTIHRVPDPVHGGHRLIMFSGLNPCRIASSDDDGATWTDLEPIGDWGGIVTMGSVVACTDGRLLALFHDDGRFIAPEPQKRGVFTLYQVESTDGGRSWTEPRSLYSDDHLHLCEPGVIRSPDGLQLAMLLRENHRVANSHVMFSRDEGKTWSSPRPLPGALTGDRHVGAYAPDGRLLISFRDTTLESPTQGDWVAWIGTWDDIVSGREGQYRVRLKDNHHRWDCAYPGVLLAEDATFILTTYGHWDEGESPYVLTIRLTLDEIDELAAEPGGNESTHNQVR